ncbi:MAG: endonuclease/exonuclease/phosphatase family protein [Candidatus Liptonbacteria bacterium]|nr:endonuclease/exonuclease/phosphatase family protein [Candidatus Liptonbacteria bacterium]
MKLICLNIWGGQIYEPLIKFVREQAESTDIFCFQEVYRSPRKDIEVSSKTRINILDELSGALPDFNYVFHPVLSGFDNSGPIDLNIEMGQVEFVKKSFPIVSSGEVSLYSSRSDAASRKQTFSPSEFGYSRISNGDSGITLINVHALTYHPDDKLDTPERLEQSRLIKKFAIKEKGNVIICGDFNILPEAESVKTFGDSFVDLIKKYDIKTTRSKISPWYGKPNELKFSDYAFVSPTLKILNFQVPDVEISDHLPLIMEFR